MDLTWTDEQEAFRAEARGWLETNVPRDLGSGDTAEGFARHLEWERKLFAERWAVVSWPEAYGGRDASIWEWLIFEEEYYRTGGPQRVTQNGIFLLAPTVFGFGNQEQQDHVLPRMASAEDLWSQGWSEPNAGSDLASVRSKAERVDGGWILNGQKTWTTRGAFCTHLFGLFRTDPDSERHKGLSYLMVPFDIDGVTVRGFGRLDGDEGFAEVFFEDAFLPDDCIPGGPILGDVDNGWRVAMATTGSERGLTLRSPGRFKATAQRLIDLWNGNDSLGNESLGNDSSTNRSPGARSDLTKDRLVDAWMRAEAYDAFTLQTVTGIDEGIEPGAESSLNKIWWSELDVELHRVALDLLGPAAELENEWSKGWQFSLSGPIYAGTNEIQRNIAAERVLGLPRVK